MESPIGLENGVEAVLVSPKGQQISILVKLNFDCTSNITKYEVCITGLQVTLEFGAYDLSIFGDSLLIISQIKGKWEAWDTKLISYQKCVSHLISKFWNITFAYLPWTHNQFVDALATLASIIKLVEGDDMWQLHIEVYMNIEECINVKAEFDWKPWYHDIKAYIKDSEYLFRATNNDRKFIRHMACQFFLSGEVLFKRNHDITLPRCIGTLEANHLMEEMHEGLLEAHASGPLLARKIIRANYYWHTMTFFSLGNGRHHTCDSESLQMGMSISWWLLITSPSRWKLFPVKASPKLWWPNSWNITSFVATTY